MTNHQDVIIDAEILMLPLGFHSLVLHFCVCIYIIITGFLSDSMEVSESADKGSQVVVTDQKGPVPSNFSSFDPGREAKVLVTWRGSTVKSVKC